MLYKKMKNRVLKTLLDSENQEERTRVARNLKERILVSVKFNKELGGKTRRQDIKHGSRAVLSLK
jgi:hypothetical protein